MRKLENRCIIHLGKICFIIILGLFLAGLWPFNFFPKNEVEWLKDTNGLNFYGRGIIYSSNLFVEQIQPTFQNDAITIELWLKSGKEPVQNLIRILSLVDNDGTEYFTIAQWKSHLYIIRDRIIHPTLPDPRQYIKIRRALLEGKQQFITVTSNKEGTAIYLKGKREKIDPKFTFINKNMDLPERLILGDSPRGHRSWFGNVFGLAIYHRALGKEEVYQNYQRWLTPEFPSKPQEKLLTSLFLFDEHDGSLVRNHGLQQYNLIIPEYYQIIQKDILRLPGKNFPRNLFKKDIVVNILGFMPIGFFFCAYLAYATRLSKIMTMLITLLLGAGLSIGIELLQFYLPSRISSSLDLICNSFGTAVGAILFQLLSKISNLVK